VCYSGICIPDPLVPTIKPGNSTMPTVSTISATTTAAATETAVICEFDEWMCDDLSECINIKLKCDGGTPECADGSDESLGNCPSTTAAATTKYEASTNIPLVCRSHEWMCDDKSECVNIKVKCDGGVPECADGSDESPENCPSTTAASTTKQGDSTTSPLGCRSDEWMCDDGTKCISAKLKCDGGLPECRDGSDESSANCPSTIASVTTTAPVTDPTGKLVCRSSAGEALWMCDSGTLCINPKLRCNGGRPDCLDGSDEAPKYCTVTGPTAKPDGSAGSDGGANGSTGSGSGTTVIVIAVVAVVVIIIVIVLALVFVHLRRRSQASDRHGAIPAASVYANPTFGGADAGNGDPHPGFANPSYGAPVPEAGDYGEPRPLVISPGTAGEEPAMAFGNPNYEEPVLMGDADPGPGYLEVGGDDVEA